MRYEKTLSHASRGLDLRGAVWTARCLDRDRGDAVRAGLLGRRRRFLLALHPVDRLHDQEDGEGDDQKVDHRVDEEADVPGGRAGRLGLLQRGILAAAEGDEGRTSVG